MSTVAGLGIMLLSCMAFAVQQAEECTLGEVKPLLRGPGVKTISAKPREVVEAARLKDGTRVQVAQGGCAHYGVQVSYEAKAKADTVASVIEVLKQLKALVENPEVFEQMSTIIERHARNAPAGEPLQDKQFEFTTVDIQREVKGTRQRIKVTYSFAL